MCRGGEILEWEELGGRRVVPVVLTCPRTHSDCLYDMINYEGELVLFVQNTLCQLL